MSSAFAIQAPSAIYREDQRFGWWLYALVAAVVAVGGGYLALRQDGPDAPGLPLGRFQFSLAVTLGVSIPAVLFVCVLKMTTEVHPTDVRIWFGWIPTYRRVVPLADIQSARVVRYRPWADCRGWGVRTGPGGERVYSARGDQGVRITLTDGASILLGSQNPDALAMAIEGAIQPTG